MKLGTKFAWLYTEGETPSVTNRDGFIFKSAREYFGRAPTSREIKAVYNAWRRDTGGSKKYALSLQNRNSATIKVNTIYDLCFILYLLLLATDIVK